MQKNDKQYYSILEWITRENIVSEKGDAFDYKDRPWLIDILCDFTPQQTCVACAQVGKSVTFSKKALFAVKYLHFNIIYTMSSDSDVSEFVNSKFNKIVQANHHEFKGMETDNVERKELNDRFIFFKGTNSKTAAISTTADLLIHDEISRSDQNAIETYKSRTKASQYKGRWLFSNPGTERDELDLQHQKSDQKEWHITCPHCKDEHYLVFPDSINIETKSYQCRNCKESISDDVRRNGRWIDRDGKVWDGTLNQNYKISGWHISHLMCPWISAEEIIEDSQGDPAYFNNFVLGKPYSPGDLSVNKTTILDLWTPKDLTTGNIYLGVDVGNIKHYVIRSEKGLLKIGRFTAWSELDDIIAFWKPKSGVIDAMPDNTASKHYVEKYPWMQMSFFKENNENPQTIVWWGDGERKGIVYSHRDRILDRMLTDMIEAKFLIGLETDNEFRLFIKHFETLRREKVVNNKGIERYCFVAGTKILTNKGLKNIEEISIEDKVLTRNGFKVVLNILERESEVIYRGILCGTADHPVFTDKGVKPLLSIPLDDRIYLCQPKQLYIRALSSLDTLIQKVLQIETILDLQARNVERKAYRDFIKRYIKIILEIFQKILLFITKTIIRLIIHQKTWSYYTERNTINITSPNTILTQNLQKKDLLNLGIRCIKDLISGKQLLKLKGFSKNILTKLGITKNGQTLCAKNVGNNAKQNIKEEESIVARNVEENGTTNTTGKKQKVYNLTVEDTPEYFANGVLVHNCWGSTTGEDHYVFACLYAYLALQGAGSGVFYNEGISSDKPSVIDIDNIYDISRAFSDAQQINE